MPIDTKAWRYSKIIYTPTDGTFVPPALPPEPHGYGALPSYLTPPVTGPGLGNGVAKKGIVPRTFTRPANAAGVAPDISAYALNGRKDYDAMGNVTYTENFKHGTISVVAGGPGVLVGAGDAWGNFFYPWGEKNGSMDPTAGMQSFVVSEGTAPSFILRGGTFTWKNHQLVGGDYVTPLGNGLWQIVQVGASPGDLDGLYTSLWRLYTQGGTVGIATSGASAPPLTFTVDYDALWTDHDPTVNWGQPTVTFTDNYDGTQSAYLVANDGSAFQPLGDATDALTFTSPYSFEVLLKSVEAQTISFNVDTKSYSIAFSSSGAYNNLDSAIVITDMGSGWLKVRYTTVGTAIHVRPVITITSSGGATNSFKFGGIQYGDYSFASPDPSTGTVASSSSSNPDYVGTYQVSTSASPIEITLAYPLDQCQTWAQPRPGGYRTPLQSGLIDYWYTGMDHVLQAKVRWVEADDTYSMGPVASRYNGVNGWDEFLKYAKSRQPFTFVPDIDLPTTTQVCYLMDPMEGLVSLDDDLTRTISLTIRSGTEFTGF